MKIEEKEIPFGKYRTYCRIVGENDARPPLILVHGGPGSTHNSFELLDAMAEKGNRKLIMYDQLGCGRSADESIPDAILDAETWLKELKNLIASLELKTYDLLGHSWGGMLVELFLTKTDHVGTRRVVLSSTLPSSALWAKEAQRLLSYLSAEDQEAVEKAQKSGEFDGEDFKTAVTHYGQRFIGPGDGEERPECLTRKKPPQGRNAYVRTWGPSEFVPLGTLKDFDVTEGLSHIDRPTLVVSGTDDESTPLINKTIFDRLRCPKRWVLLPSARHMTYYDQNEKYMEAVIDFLEEE